MLATVAVIKRAWLMSVESRECKKTIPTIWNVENDRSADQQSDDLDRVTNRLELRSHRGAEAHITDDDCRERVHDTIGYSPRE
jgi:hypothetical protein